MRRRSATLVLVCVVAAAGGDGAAATRPDSSERLVLRVARAFDGCAWRDDVVVVVEGGVIKSVSSGRASRDLPALDLEDAVLTPGLIDLDAAIGLRGRRDEIPEAVSPDLLVIDGFDPDDREVEAFRRSGFTAAWLGSGAIGVFGGLGAVIQPAAGGARPTVTERRWGPCGSLASTARLAERAPASLALQAVALREALRAVPSSAGPARIRFDDGASARQAALVRNALVVGLPESSDVVELSLARGVVFSGLSPAAEPDEIAAAAAVTRSGQPFGFGSGDVAGEAAAARRAASRLVEAGLSPAAALAALTSQAAALLGLPRRGTLAPGAIADLVAWSGDPVTLTSRPLRTWVAGRQVFEASAGDD